MKASLVRTSIQSIDRYLSSPLEVMSNSRMPPGGIGPAGAPVSVLASLTCRFELR